MRPTRRAGTLTLAALAATSCFIGSAVASASSVPAATSGVRLAHLTGSSLTVAANRSEHATSYRLFVSRYRSDLYLVNLRHARHTRVMAQSSTPKITVRGLRYVTAPYYFRFEARSGSGTRASAIRSTRLRPAVPSGVRVTGSHLRSLVWHPVVGTGYAVTESTNAAMSRARKVYTIRGAHAALTPSGLRQGTRYYFRVQALNGATKSYASVRVSISSAVPQNTTNAPVLGAAPAGMSYPKATLANTGADAMTAGTGRTRRAIHGNVTLTASSPDLSDADVYGQVLFAPSASRWTPTLTNVYVHGSRLPTLSAPYTKNYESSLGLIQNTAASNASIHLDGVTLVPDYPDTRWDGLLGHDFSSDNWGLLIAHVTDGVGIQNVTAGTNPPINITLNRVFIDWLAFWAFSPGSPNNPQTTHNDDIQGFGGTNIRIGQGSWLGGFQSMPTGFTRPNGLVHNDPFGYVGQGASYVPPGGRHRPGQQQRQHPDEHHRRNLDRARPHRRLPRRRQLRHQRRHQHQVQQLQHHPGPLRQEPIQVAHPVLLVQHRPPRAQLDLRHQPPRRRQRTHDSLSTTCTVRSSGSAAYAMRVPAASEAMSAAIDSVVMRSPGTSSGMPGG